MKNQKIVQAMFWERLLKIKKLSFRANSFVDRESGWQGVGEVKVLQQSNTVIFNERGTWRGKQGIEMNFTNVFRWTLDKQSLAISLEHLRFGPSNPVFLFDLVPSSKKMFSSINAHHCQKDIYFCQVRLNHCNLHLNWRVMGPRKNEEMNAFYF